ncbi:MAG: hotdog fold domain-containing protein [Roseomonas sp.]
MSMTYRVEAYNLSHASENRIHDDATAQRFGFTGGLVPGVEVFAYCCHPPVETWGRDFLRRGEISAGFQKPVYDGRIATISATPDRDGLALSVESEGIACASGFARLPEASPAPIVLADWQAPLPPEARPKASDESLAPGLWLGTRGLELTQQVMADYLRDVRETTALYAEQGIAHPGLILRMCNWLLTQNVVLGPWIHIASEVRFHSEARLGETLTASGRITANIERKGHRIVTIEALVLANAARPIAQVTHEAIWRPRQVAEAG